MMARFMRDYLVMLDERIDTILEQLEHGNDLNVHVALLSLESSSSMVGATEMARLVNALRDSVEHGQRTMVPALALAIANEAELVHARYRR